MTKSVNEQGVQWDLTSYFPAFNGPEMMNFKKKLAADIAKDIRPVK